MWLQHYVPILRWLPYYQPGLQVGRDVVAGLTVGVMAVPQALSYAGVAGLSPQFGLYNAFVGLLPYFAFGTSPQLISGPTAVMSIMTRSQVPDTYAPETLDYEKICFILALFAGIIQILLGVLRMGQLINLIGAPIIVGFTTASAFLIAATQFSNFLGVPKCQHFIEKPNPNPSVNGTMAAGADDGSGGPEIKVKVKCNFIEEVSWVASKGLTKHSEIKGYVVLASAICVSVLLFFKYFLKPRLPQHLKPLGNLGPLLLVVVTIPIWYVHGEALEKVGLNMAGKIPDHLPNHVNPFEGMHAHEVTQLIGHAVVIAAVGYMESMTIATTVARKYGGYKIDPSQEMTALGVCNIVCSQFQGYPVTGSFSRTAVNADSGASSGFASVICAVVVGVAILTLTSLLQYLPKVVLASIIMVSVINLIEFGEAAIFYRTTWPDFIVFLVVFVLVLTIGVEDGLIIGILVQWVLSLTSTHWAASPVAVLGQVKDNAILPPGGSGVPTEEEEEQAMAEVGGGAGGGKEDGSGSSVLSGGMSTPGAVKHASSIVHSASVRLSSRRRLVGESGPTAEGLDPEVGPVDPHQDAAVLEPLYPGRHLVDLADARFAHLMRAGAAGAVGGLDGASRGTVVVVEVQSPIIFANAEKLRQTLDECISVFQPRVVVLSCIGVTAVDSTGTGALRSAVLDARARKVLVFLTGMAPALARTLTSGLTALDEGHGAPPVPLDDEIEKQMEEAMEGAGGGSGGNGGGGGDQGKGAGIRQQLSVELRQSPVGSGPQYGVTSSINSPSSGAGGMTGGMVGSSLEDAKEGVRRACRRVLGAWRRCSERGVPVGGGLLMFWRARVAVRHGLRLAAALDLLSEAEEAAAGVGGGGGSSGKKGKGTGEDEQAQKKKDQERAALGLGEGGMGVPLSPVVLAARKQAAADRLKAAQEALAVGQHDTPSDGSTLVSLVYARRAPDLRKWVGVDPEVLDGDDTHHDVHLKIAARTKSTGN